MLRKLLRGPINKYKQNSRMMWKTLNELLNKTKKNNKMSKTLIENCSSNVLDDPKTIADNFNEYFINIGPCLANKIKNNDNNSFEKYLKGSYQSSFFLILSQKTNLKLN